MLRPRYYSYLIRLWQEDGAGETDWRFVLVNLNKKGEQRGFASLDELVVFLQDQVDALSSHNLVVQSAQVQQRIDSGADSLFEQCQEEGGDAVTS